MKYSKFKKLITFMMIKKYKRFWSMLTKFWHDEIGFLNLINGLLLSSKSLVISRCIWVVILFGFPQQKYFKKKKNLRKSNVNTKDSIEILLAFFYITTTNTFCGQNVQRIFYNNIYDRLINVHIIWFYDIVVLWLDFIDI